MRVWGRSACACIWAWMTGHLAAARVLCQLAVGACFVHGVRGVKKSQRSDALLRRHLLLRRLRIAARVNRSAHMGVKYDAVHALAVAAVALRLYARERTVWDTLQSDALEASAAVAVFYAFLSMMGNSPLAWPVVCAYACV